jgi:hypothetical protein
MGRANLCHRDGRCLHDRIAVRLCEHSGADRVSDAYRAHALATAKTQIREAGVQLSLEVFNHLNGHDNDIDYFYTSRLPGEPLAGVDDVHTHPSEPREFRAAITASF